MLLQHCTYVATRDARLLCQFTNIGTKNEVFYLPKCRRTATFGPSYRKCKTIVLPHLRKFDDTMNNTPGLALHALLQDAMFEQLDVMLLYF
jgi:hypothetical protein